MWTAADTPTEDEHCGKLQFLSSPSTSAKCGLEPERLAEPKANPSGCHSAAPHVALTSKHVVSLTTVERSQNSSS